MESEFIRTTEECSHAAIKNEITFPEVLQRLTEIGVERYHADYSRHEITYYHSDGTSHVVSLTPPQAEIGLEFCADIIESAVKQSQQNEHTYNDFLRKTMRAGCVGYFVQITGKQVIYFGRNGDTHVERFPGSVGDRLATSLCDS